MVTVFCPLITTGPGETALQDAGPETRLVLDCKVKPVELAGQVTITLFPERMMVSLGPSNVGGGVFCSAANAIRMPAPEFRSQPVPIMSRHELVNTVRTWAGVRLGL